ncbi:MAG: hypothetical protein R6U17_02360 [Thermoplasmata archaeon]
MRVLHVCSEKAVPMLNIIRLYRQELEKYGIGFEYNTTGQVNSDHDIVHGHYSLTRPVIKACLRSRILGVPFIIHHHGSDVRRITVQGEKRLLPHHAIVSSFVRKLSDKVLMSTPDLLEWASGFYLPNPVDLHRFRPIDIEKNERVLLFGRFVSKEALLPLLRKEERYDILNWGLNMKLAKNVRKISFQPNNRLPALFNKYKKMIGPLADPVSLGRLEAMACGLNTYTDFPKKYEVFYGFENPDKVKDPRAFVKKYHDPKKIVRILVEMYEEIIER